MGIIFLCHVLSENIDDLINMVLLWLRIVVQICRLIFVIFMIRKSVKQTKVLKVRISILEEDLVEPTMNKALSSANIYVDGEMADEAN